IWTGAKALPAEQARFIREEALWEYWRRVAGGDGEFREAELVAAFSAGIRGVRNAVCELARRDRIPAASRERARQLLQQIEPEEASLAIVQLNAREALEALKGGANSARRDLLEAVLAKGASWAAVQAMPFLTDDEQGYLVGMAERRKTFTRAQRHELR